MAKEREERGEGRGRREGGKGGNARERVSQFHTLAAALRKPDHTLDPLNASPQAGKLRAQAV